MNEAKLKRLLQEYFNDSINSAELAELLSYIKNTPTEFLESQVPEELLELHQGKDLTEKQSADLWQRINSDVRYLTPAIPEAEAKPHIIRLYSARWLRGAAAILIAAVVGLLTVHLQKGTVKQYTAVRHSHSPIIPGGRKATLTTGGGRVIELESTADGLIGTDNDYTVHKAHSGQIIYNSKAGVAEHQPLNYNTLTTPKGGEYQVVLSDGTKVWLNSASSLIYPVIFTGSERRVQLKGEAYFEVAKNSHQPFYVSTGNGQIRVMGTHFNISAYADDEFTTTTLLEGSVQVTKNQSVSMLVPGQQASISRQSDHIMVAPAHIEEAMAWKNGYFIFDEDNIAGIMKKVARWYDVDVQYQGSFNSQKFGGTFSRSKSIADLLHYLETIGGIHFKVQERRITVMN